MKNRSVKFTSRIATRIAAIAGRLRIPRSELIRMALAEALKVKREPAPNPGAIQALSVKIDDKLWQSALAESARSGRSIGELVDEGITIILSSASAEKK